MRYVRTVLIFAAIYWASALLGLNLATISRSVASIWPASGVAIGLLVLFGPGYWPAIALGALLANLQADSQFLLALAIAVGNTLEATVGALMIQRLTKNGPFFGAHTSSIAVIGAGVLATTVSASVGVSALWLVGKLSGQILPSAWLTWWIGDTLGVLIITPFLLTWSGAPTTIYSSWLRLVGVGTIGIGIGASWLMLPPTLAALFLFVLFPYFLWCSTILTDREAKAVAIFIACVCIVSTAMGVGAFISGNANANLIQLQLFLSSFAVTALLLCDFRRQWLLSRPAAAVLLAGWALSAGAFGQRPSGK